MLTDELCLEQAHPQYKPMMKAVRNLALVVVESKHIIIVESLQVALYFINQFAGQDDIVSVFYKVKADFYTFSHDHITRRVDIGLNTSSCIQDNGIEIYPTSIDEFQDSSWCQKSIVLGENTTDVDLFEIILKWFIKQNAIPYNTNFEKALGGGATTKSVMENHIKMKKIFLTILDSDRKYPGCKIGGTLKECKSLSNKQNHVFKLHALDVHETENLLPFCFLDHDDMFHAKVKEQKEQFDLIRERDPDLLRFFDLKNGIKKTGEVVSKQQYRDYIVRCCKCNDSISDVEKHINLTSNDEVIYPGLQKSILSVALKHKDNQDQFDFELVEYQTEEWLKIGQLMLDFACARNTESCIS